MPRSSLPVTTVHPGEQVRVDLRSRRSGVYAYIGIVIAVDARALRLRDVSKMASYDGEIPHSSRAVGDVIVPWTAVLSVRVVGEEAT